MTEKILNAIAAAFPLTPVAVPEEYRKMKVSGMDFRVSAYEAEGLGRVSLMQASGFFGLMKMDTLIVSPVKKDAPIYSYDRIFAMGNDTLIVEYYDTVLSPYDAASLMKAKAEGNALPERDPGSHWYDTIKSQASISKKAKKVQKIAMDELAISSANAFIALSQTLPDCDEGRKMEKNRGYVEGLLINGGPSTDVFLKKMGNEKTQKLFYEVLFGVK